MCKLKFRNFINYLYIEILVLDKVLIVEYYKNEEDFCTGNFNDIKNENVFFKTLHTQLMS